MLGGGGPNGKWNETKGEGGDDGVNQKKVQEKLNASSKPKKGGEGRRAEPVNVLVKDLGGALAKFHHKGGRGAHGKGGFLFARRGKRKNPRRFAQERTRIRFLEVFEGGGTKKILE